ncbi:MAG: hypothetical protein O7G86_13945, partial [Gammaproteobacteria bacterium]|nr:hypothetical protein [Gammaproteobacteria bacterium]
DSSQIWGFLSGCVRQDRYTQVLVLDTFDPGIWSEEEKQLGRHMGPPATNWWTAFAGSAATRGPWPHVAAHERVTDA